MHVMGVSIQEDLKEGIRKKIHHSSRLGLILGTPTSTRLPRLLEKGWHDSSCHGDKFNVPVF